MEIIGNRSLLLIAFLLSVVGVIRRTHGTKSDLLPSDCGTSVVSGGELTGENGASLGSYPWMAILRYNTSKGFSDSCLGSLINKRYVLTVAHCLRNLPVKLHSIILGEYDKAQNPDCYDTNCVGPVEEFGIESVVVHPDHSLRKKNNDIGLIRLERDVTMKDHIQPICLPVTAELREQGHESYVVTSWKRKPKIAQITSDPLQKVVVRQMDSADCRKKFSNLNAVLELTENQLCTEASEAICVGSAGAPLGNTVGTSGDRFVQFGIISFGSRVCGDSAAPEVSTRVASYMDWILNTIVP